MKENKIEICGLLEAVCEGNVAKSDHMSVREFRERLSLIAVLQETDDLTLPVRKVFDLERPMGKTGTSDK